MPTFDIHSQGQHRLRKAMACANPISAHVIQTDTGLQIEFSDGRSTHLANDPQIPTDRFIAAAVQWVRRHGATSLEIELI